MSTATATRLSPRTATDGRIVVPPPTVAIVPAATAKTRTRCPARLTNGNYPLAPLIALICETNRDTGEATRSEHHAARVLGASGFSFERAKKDGLSEQKADVWATRVGMHPTEIWTDYGRPTDVTDREVQDATDEAVLGAVVSDHDADEHFIEGSDADLDAHPSKRWYGWQLRETDVLLRDPDRGIPEDVLVAEVNADHHADGRKGRLTVKSRRGDRLDLKMYTTYRVYRDPLLGARRRNVSCSPSRLVAGQVFLHDGDRLEVRSVVGVGSGAPDSVRLTVGAPDGDPMDRRLVSLDRGKRVTVVRPPDDETE